jgi:class 3 adenylate cyclase
MKLNSIRIKIISLIFFVLLLIVAASLLTSASSQRSNLLAATERTLITNMEILNRVIRNIMVKGEAPIAVDTMASLGQIQEFRDIRIFRIDGTNAFNDYTTVDFVNKYQSQVIFPRTARLEKAEISDEAFARVLSTNAPVQARDLGKQKSIEYYYPILNNDDRCKACHGDPAAGFPFIRGVAHFKISIDQTYAQIDRATLFLTAFFVAIGVIFAVVLFFFMRGLIISPLNKIGSTVRAIGQGRLDARAEIKSKDELGDLAAKINDMIKGLNERFHLTKYVSRSTEDLVVRGGEAVAGGKLRIAVLFSDIRGFTAYSESRQPEEVIRDLNAVLEIQAEIVVRYGGDIDKFVGDELMARFEDEYAAVCCAVDLVKAVIALDRERRTGLRIGVGVNSGPVIAGNIGSQSRMEYAVIGDTVNLASRLSGLAKKNMVLISSGVNAAIAGRAETVLIAGRRIKGKAEAVDVYAVKSVGPVAD